MEYVLAMSDNFTRSSMSMMSIAHRLTSAMLEGNASLEQTVARLLDLDAWVDAALRSNATARRLSKIQGANMLSLVKSGDMLGGKEVACALIKMLHDHARCNRTSGHASIVQSVIFCCCGLSETESRTMSLFLLARGLLSAAVRLNAQGPMAAFSQLCQVEPCIDDLVNKFQGILPLSVSSYPILDLLQEMHPRLYSKMFQG